MYYTYVIECRDKSLYTGYTTNVEERLRKHNGLMPGGAKYTSGRRPVRLVLVEEYKTKSEAMQREVLIKSLSREAKLELINSAEI